MANFTVVSRAKWKEHKWDKLFNLVNDFKKEFSLNLRYINNWKGRFSLSLGDHSIIVEENTQGFWITLESFTDKSDFDEKYEYIFSRLDDDA